MAKIPDTDQYDNELSRESQRPRGDGHIVLMRMVEYTQPQRAAPAPKQPCERRYVVYYIDHYPEECGPEYHRAQRLAACSPEDERHAKQSVHQCADCFHRSRAEAGTSEKTVGVQVGDVVQNEV